MKDISEVLKSGKAVFGTEKTIKLLKNNKTSTVFLASNCNGATKESIMHYSKINKVDVVELDMKNNELGVFCKKPFSVSVLCVEK